MSLKLTQPHWKVGEFDGSTPPYVYADDFQGDETSLTRNSMTFRLKEGSTVEDAQELAKVLTRLVATVGEQS